MNQIYQLNEMKKVGTKYIGFYRKIKELKIIEHMHQLFTYACLVGVKEDKKSDGSKTDDICNVGNIEKSNLEVVKGIVLMKCEPQNADELLREIESYADGGIEILMRDFENEGTIRLDKYI